MSARELPDFAGWSPDRLSGQRDHLVQILMTMAGQPDPLKSRLRSELAAIHAELARPTPESHSHATDLDADTCPICFPAAAPADTEGETR